MTCVHMLTTFLMLDRRIYGRDDRLQVSFFVAKLSLAIILIEGFIRLCHCMVSPASSVCY